MPTVNYCFLRIVEGNNDVTALHDRRECRHFVVLSFA